MDTLWGSKNRSKVTLDPLTTDDTVWRRLTLAACYQLAQSVLKIVLCEG